MVVTTSVATLTGRFRQIIRTEEELQTLLGEPSDLVRNKVRPVLDAPAREFLVQSPFYILATASEHGTCDATPRGDPSGSVLVLDDRTLVLPDRPGNRLVDSLRNIIANPHVGLLFMIPGKKETLRVNGRALVVGDEELLAQLAVGEKQPKLAIVVEVEEVFFHCAKAFIRSQLWQPQTWPDAASLPSLGAMLKDQLKLDESARQIDAGIQESYEKRLY